MNFDKLLFDRFQEDFTKLKPAQLKSLIRVKTQTVIPSLDDIDFTSKQRVKIGIDPTGVDLHLGHLVPLMILNIFVKSGHHVDFVIGDFTATVGDPSGQVAERAVITAADIERNYQTYVAQVGKYIDTKKFNTRRNSEWLDKIPLREAYGVFAKLNLATAIQREDFRKRMETGGVSVAEVCYAALMGWDSVALNTTIELGGLDQLLNLQQCREIQRIYGQKPEVIITTPILEGLSGDGRKMSKSYNNYIAINSTSEDKFGKIMSLPDGLLMQYFKCFGYLYEEELKELEAFIKKSPMEAKKQLATYVVAMETGLQAGQKEREHFEQKFSKKQLADSDFVKLNIKKGTMLLDALMTSGQFASKGELKRLLTSKAIKNLDADKSIEVDITLTNGVKVRVGKLKFFELVVN